MHATELAHKRPALTAQHRENFRKLADYVLNLPDDYKGFSMVDYCRTIAPPVSTGRSRDWQPQQAKNVVEKHKCGTSACMLGHGPAAGISAEEYPTWGKYADAKFGCNPHNSTEKLNLWSWAFSGEWTYHAPTRADAAMRIKYLLDYGLPKTFQRPSSRWAAIVAASYEVK